MFQSRQTASEWHRRALEARILAATLHDPVAKEEVLRIAEAYDRLADRAQRADRASGTD